MIAYRKTKDGEWVAFGPTSEVRVGQVSVSKRDGSTKIEYAARLGRPFRTDRGEYVYGYLRRSGNGHSHSQREKCAECGDRWAVTEAEDASGCVAPVCARCASYSRWERSYG